MSKNTFDFMKFSKLIFYSLIFSSALFGLSSCTNTSKLKLDYSFEAAIDAEQGVKNFNELDFKTYDNLELGFHRGNVWIKLDITNKNQQASYIIVNNDLINRNYRFYKLDKAKNKLMVLNPSKDFTRRDHRTFNYPKPNFQIDLEPQEQATYFVYTESDGRIVQATPRLMNIEEYTDSISHTKRINAVFFILVGGLLIINIFHFSVLRNKIYYYYWFYILSTCLMYLSVEGSLFDLGLSSGTIDHIVFIFIRIWTISIVLFTAYFLKFKGTNPKYYSFIKKALILVIGSTTIYQFSFYNSSISYLHSLENIFTQLWLVVLISMIILSFKRRKVETKYYMITFSLFILFVTLALLDSHFSFLPGSPFLYFKLGTIIEFIGFTYFITVIIRKNVKNAGDLKHELAENQQKLMLAHEKLDNNLEVKSIEKADLSSVFKLIESSLSTETEWFEFKSNFEKLSPNFLWNLKQKHSELSKSDIRLIVLIKIGFSQKEIATVLGIAPDSVKKAKQRLRKKLNLTSTIILKEYLSRYS
jgi:DNA-binding CsgD family transcriptional regulator